MPAGFEAWGDHGYQQIDGNYRNLRLFDHGICSCDQASTSGAGIYIGAITVTRSAPVVAFRCSVYCVPQQVDLGNGSFSYRFLTKGAALVEYFVFSPDAPVTPGNSGLQVFNPAGQLVFDSSDKAMKVLDFYVGTGGNLRTYGPRIAICANFSTASRNTQISQGGSVRTVYSSSWMTRTPAENQVEHSLLEILRMNYNGGWPRSDSSLTSYIVVDVTGL